jgi:RHS repeat-associated protein
LGSKNAGSSLRLVYYKARVYHPELGRFMQTDPIGYEDGMNWYAHVGNDPINHKDPSGMWSTKAHNSILDYAFGGRLSKTELRVLKISSLMHDISTQSASQQYMHSMGSKVLTPVEAKEARDKFVGEQISIAGNLKRSVRSRGQAMTKAFHAIADSFSPAHVDPDGNLLIYEGENKSKHTAFEGQGIEGVKDLTPEILDKISAQLNKAMDQIEKQTCMGSRIRRSSC